MPCGFQSNCQKLVTLVSRRHSSIEIQSWDATDLQYIYASAVCLSLVNSANAIPVNHFGFLGFC